MFQSSDDQTPRTPRQHLANDGFFLFQIVIRHAGNRLQAGPFQLDGYSIQDLGEYEAAERRHDHTDEVGCARGQVSCEFIRHIAYRRCRRLDFLASSGRNFANAPQGARRGHFADIGKLCHVSELGCVTHSRYLLRKSGCRVFLRTSLRFPFLNNLHSVRFCVWCG
jgi:hypothetical protein